MVYNFDVFVSSKNPSKKFENVYSIPYTVYSILYIHTLIGILYRSDNATSTPPARVTLYYFFSASSPPLLHTTCHSAHATDWRVCRTWVATTQPLQRIIRRVSRSQPYNMIHNIVSNNKTAIIILSYNVQNGIIYWPLSFQLPTRQTALHKHIGLWLSNVTLYIIII